MSINVNGKIHGLLSKAAGAGAALLLGTVCAVMLGEGALRIGGALERRAQERRNAISLARPGSYRIMCLGESTTAGGENAWPARLERLLNERYPGMTFSVVNKAVAGADMAALMNSLEKNLDEVRPDMVMTMMGINDGSIRYYQGLDGSGFLFGHSALYRWFRLVSDPRVIQRKTVPSIPPNTQARGQEDPWLTYAPRNSGTGERLRKDLAGNPSDPMALYLLGKYLTSQPLSGQPDKRVAAEGETLLLRAAALRPGKSYVYMALGQYYQSTGKSEKAVAMMEKSAELNAGLDNWYWLGRYCHKLGMKDRAEKALQKAVKFDKIYDEALFELVALRLEQERYAEAEELLLKAAAAAPENEKIPEALISFYQDRGRPEKAESCRRELENKRAQLTSRTRGYYQRLNGILRARGMRLACLQYPMCPLGPLRLLLADLPGVIFVDNEGVFRRAVAAKGSGYYFLDLFGGNFGHLTDEGHELLARNAADSLAPYLSGLKRGRGAAL